MGQAEDIASIGQSLARLWGQRADNPLSAPLAVNQHTLTNVWKIDGRTLTEMDFWSPSGFNFNTGAARGDNDCKFFVGLTDIHLDSFGIPYVDLDGGANITDVSGAMVINHVNGGNEILFTHAKLGFFGAAAAPRVSAASISTLADLKTYLTNIGLLS